MNIHICDSINHTKIDFPQFVDECHGKGPLYDNNKDCETHYRVEGMQIYTIFSYSFISVFIQIKNIISRDCNNKWFH